jgi:hypothetical protein
MTTPKYRCSRLPLIITSLALTTLITSPGCRSYGPGRIPADRFDYNAAIADSWQTQSLLAIVKLRHSEWPVFLDVEQVVTQYTFENTGTAKGILRLSEYEQGELGWVGKYSERPVILYKPLKGTRYMRSMLTPIPVGAILGLIQTGWPANRMLETMVHSANGYRNTQVEQGLELRSDPVFAQFLETLQRFQSQDALVMEVEAIRKRDADKPIIKTRMGFRTDRVDTATKDALTAMQKALGLSTGTNRYDVVWGAISPNDTTIALETRSVLQLMVVLAAHVEVAPEDMEQGRIETLRARPTYDRSGLGPLIDIRRGKKAPTDAFVVCHYRNHDFWIEDTNVKSKRTFSYLTLLLTLGDVDKDAGAQLVITTN